MPVVAREEQSLGRIGRHRGFPAGHERQLAVLRIRQRLLEVVPDSEIQRHPRVDPEIVLCEDAEVRAAVDFPDRRVLRHRRRQPEQEVGVRVAGLARVEREHAVIVEQRVVNDVLVRHLSADLQRVVAARHRHAVFHREEIAAGIGAGDRRLSREVAGDGDARQRGIPLNLKFEFRSPSDVVGLLTRAPYCRT